MARPALETEALMGAPPFDIVVPTIGRSSLAALLGALAAGDGPAPGRILLVDDRRDATTPLLPAGAPPALASPIVVRRGRAAGPAAARNVGWRAAGAAWIAFLDDDVLPEPDWLARLAEDLADLDADVAGSQGVVHVPMPGDRRPTDWERNTRALEDARWATADMAYRRDALLEVGGFDERFRRAYREDADLALRITDAGWRLVRGRRVVAHPVRPADRWVSVRMQRGNAADVLMCALHGPRWRERCGAPRGRRPRHLALSAAAVATIVGLLARRPRVAALAAALWLAGTAELAWARIAPGPRSLDEVATMLLTSAALPHAATWHWLRGWAQAIARRDRVSGRGGSRDVNEPSPTAVAAGNARARSRVPAPGSMKSRVTPRVAVAARPRAVLLDRDGTLVVDVPHNGDPDLVRPVPGAREALDRLRAAGIRLAVVSNQSGVARGLLRHEQVDAVNRRVDELLGPLGAWFVCPHASDDGCECRKPAPGLVLRATAALGVSPAECLVIGDTGADVDAARAAGARAVLVPNPVTRREEIDAAPEVAPDLGAAVDLVLGVAR